MYMFISVVSIKPDGVVEFFSLSVSINQAIQSIEIHVSIICLVYQKKSHCEQ